MSWLLMHLLAAIPCGLHQVCKLHAWA